MSQKFIDLYVPGIMSYLNSKKNIKVKIIDFQQFLFEIPSWSDKAKQKEYKITLDFLPRKTEKTLKKVFEHKLKQLGSNMRLKITLFDFWYRSLRHIAKYLYESYINHHQNSLDHRAQVIKIIKRILHKYIPIADLILHRKKDDPIPVNYNFDDLTKESRISKESIKKEIKEVQELYYIPSENLPGEYYESDSNKNKKIIKLKN